MSRFFRAVATLSRTVKVYERRGSQSEAFMQLRKHPYRSRRNSGPR